MTGSTCNTTLPNPDLLPVTQCIKNSHDLDGIFADSAGKSMSPVLLSACHDAESIDGWSGLHTSMHVVNAGTSGTSITKI